MDNTKKKQIKKEKLHSKKKSNKHNSSLSDIDYIKNIESTLTEWDSQNDEEDYKDLQND